MAILVAVAPQAAVAKLLAINSGGLPSYNSFGDLVGYYIFAEENAPLTPVPLIELYNTETKRREPLVQIPVTARPSPRRVQYARRRGVTVTRTFTKSFHAFKSLSETIQFRREAFLQWHVRSAPFGALSAVGPQRFYPNDNSQFVLAGLRFRTAGRYEVAFNATTLTNRVAYFNRTIFVQRQPNTVVHATNIAGYNGSTFFPAPTAQLKDFVGQNVLTSTANVTLEFEVMPAGARVTGTLSKMTDVNGRVVFSDVTPSLPGTYTMRMAAVLSDGARLTTASQLVVVERALPVQIIVEQQITGIARFQFYTQPIFSIRDSAGPSQDPRSNMTLTISYNQPEFSYEGLNTAATLSGRTSVDPVNYRYTFTNVAIDLPGRYVIDASLLLPTGATLTRQLSVTLPGAPTFEILGTFTVNKPGIITLHGGRPKVSRVFLRLALDEQCLTVSSDTIEWPASATGDEFNITVVPFNDKRSYLCMSIPSQLDFAPLVQRYLSQYGEQVPLILTFEVESVSACAALTELEAAAYRSAGWDSAAPFRRYGCALEPPVAGTIPACNCPAPLVCREMRHEKFQPPNWNIGQCVCCETWVLVVAGLIPALFFAGLIMIIYYYV